VVGRPFGKRSYGIGVPQNSVYKERLNSEILEMEAKNTLEGFVNKWWKNNAKCRIIAPDLGNDLAIFEMAGVFLVLAVGLILAIGVLCIEKQASGFLQSRKQHNQSLSKGVKMSDADFDKNSRIIKTSDGHGDVNGYSAIPIVLCNCHEKVGISDVSTETDTLV